MQPLFTEDQHVIQTFLSDTPQKAFTDGIGSWRVRGRFENLDTARCCHSSETGSKLAIMIANEVLRRLSIGSCLSSSTLLVGLERGWGDFVPGASIDSIDIADE